MKSSIFEQKLIPVEVEIVKSAVEEEIDE